MIASPRLMYRDARSGAFEGSSSLARWNDSCAFLKRPRRFITIPSLRYRLGLSGLAFTPAVITCSAFLNSRLRI